MQQDATRINKGYLDEAIWDVSVIGLSRSFKLQGERLRSWHHQRLQTSQVNSSNSSLIPTNLRTRQKPLPRNHLPPRPAMESLWKDMDLLPAQSRVESHVSTMPLKGWRLDNWRRLEVGWGWFHDPWPDRTDQWYSMIKVQCSPTFTIFCPSEEIVILAIWGCRSYRLRSMDQRKDARSATKIMPKRQTWNYMDQIESVLHSNPKYSEVFRGIVRIPIQIFHRD